MEQKILIACNFCSNCIKTCDHDAIRITPRPPTSELWFIKKPRFEESFLATALIGIVVSQTMIMLEVWESFMKWFENTTGITNFPVAWTLIFAGAMLLFPWGLEYTLRIMPSIWAPYIQHIRYPLITQK